MARHETRSTVHEAENGHPAGHKMYIYVNLGQLGRLNLVHLQMDESSKTRASLISAPSSNVVVRRSHTCSQDGAVASHSHGKGMQPLWQTLAPILLIYGTENEQISPGHDSKSILQAL